MWFWDEYKPTRPDQWDGSLADVRASRLEGLASYSNDTLVEQAGALAGVILVAVLRIMPLSPVRNANVLFFAVFFALYGGYLGRWRKRDLHSTKRYHFLKRELMPHSVFSYWFVPFVPVIYMLLMPELNPSVSDSVDTFTGSCILVIVFFWLGAAFDYFWEGLHNFSLVRLNRLNPDLINEFTLRMWIPRELANSVFRLDDVQCKDGEVFVRGWFEEPAELRRKLALLDFVHHVSVEQADQKPAS